MNKSKKITITIVFIILFLLFYIFMLPYIYLGLKYDNVTDFKFVKYIPAKIEYFSTALFLPEPGIIDGYWRFEKDGITFNIQTKKLRIRDDYQLEEIENLCTKYLQQNVDENIAGITLNSEFIYNFNKSNITNKPITEKDICNFIISSLKLEQTTYIYYKDDYYFNLVANGDYDLVKEKRKKIADKLLLNGFSANKNDIEFVDNEIKFKRSHVLDDKYTYIIDYYDKNEFGMYDFKIE